MPGFILAPGADALSVATALSRLEQDLGGLPAETVDRVIIVVGELAANVVEHGQNPVRVVWHIRADGLDLDVVGKGPGAAALHAAALPAPEATRGRGLYLIRSLATSVVDLPDGLRLHFEI